VEIKTLNMYHMTLYQKPSTSLFILCDLFLSLPSLRFIFLVHFPLPLLGISMAVQSPTTRFQEITLCIRSPIEKIIEQLYKLFTENHYTDETQHKPPSTRLRLLSAAVTNHTRVLFSSLFFICVYLFVSLLSTASFLYSPHTSTF
jgi:hypothetical protein